MDQSQQILSDLVVFQKYAKYVPALKRRETWDELCDRNAAMHKGKYPMLAAEIDAAYQLVRQKKVLPSMRSLQFGGAPIELSNNRIFNCAYAAVDHPFVFAEAMFLLLGGTGFGYSVQHHHVAKLPVIQGPTERTRRHLIGDSIEGWADAIKVLVKAYTQGKSQPLFDYRDIRPKGARLVTSGGKAPGPDPLRVCVVKVENILRNAVGRKLSTIECHDIMCHIADAVLSGGIRRAALISLFSKDDADMLAAKSGSWWEENPQRGRANNSVSLLREDTSEDEFTSIWERVKLSGAGEPGIFWTNSLDMGTNPCCFVGDTQITTDTGVMSIADIVSSVNSGGEVMVKTFNEESKDYELKPVITGCVTKKNATVITLDIEKDDGSCVSITCTPDHKFLTSNRGWVAAINLASDDDIIEQN